MQLRYSLTAHFAQKLLRSGPKMRVFKTAGLVLVFLSVARASEEYDTEFNPNDYIGYPNDPQVSYGNAVSSLLPGPYPEDPPLSETIDRVAQFDMNELGQFVDQSPPATITDNPSSRTLFVMTITQYYPA
ncbi:hypothetical protein BJ085DRAFT_34185 [Dimargaris cristalligena]|uniref:Uncharacterized protein n=1 Tax=Dimargaris cristalligena TaxID=215637 RepID=A0A4P9ZKK2_9FUNG|nr:hypothetical protein BJ085DRAFT_34185 [Dimargaris cristalligena]|eukprot:RKP33625.1 hypothetical protein BJ085DRAFT_34185 [Dimargaris cristalligena]